MKNDAAAGVAVSPSEKPSLALRPRAFVDALKGFVGMHRTDPKAST